MAAAIAGCYGAGTWKQCSIVKGDVLLDSAEGFKNCGEFCPYMHRDEEEEVKGNCKSYPSGYFCQCRFGATNKNTQQSCKVIDISKVADNSDGLDTCESWCRESEKTNTGTCIPYISGWYCDCH